MNCRSLAGWQRKKLWCNWMQIRSAQIIITRYKGALCHVSCEYRLKHLELMIKLVQRCISLVWMFSRKQLVFLCCLKMFRLSSKRLLQFWGSMRETQVFNPEWMETITNKEQVFESNSLLWHHVSHPHPGVNLWRVFAPHLWFPVTPWDHMAQVGMGVKPPGDGSQDRIVVCRQGVS